MATYGLLLDDEHETDVPTRAAMAEAAGFAGAFSRVCGLPAPTLRCWRLINDEDEGTVEHPRFATRDRLPVGLGGWTEPGTWNEINLVVRPALLPSPAELRRRVLHELAHAIEHWCGRGAPLPLPDGGSTTADAFTKRHPDGRAVCTRFAQSVSDAPVLGEPFFDRVQQAVVRAILPEPRPASPSPHAAGGCPGATCAYGDLDDNQHAWLHRQLAVSDGYAGAVCDPARTGSGVCGRFSAD